MTLYAVAQRHDDGTYSSCVMHAREKLAGILDWLRSEWVMANPNTRGGFPVALAQQNGEWYECAETAPYKIDTETKAIFATTQIEVVDSCDCAHQDDPVDKAIVEEAERKGREVNDPYRPASPNILTFGIANRSTKYDNLLHYWVLRDSSGGRIGSSADYFESKEEAMLNAIALFGKEIWAGYHVVGKAGDYGLIQQLGVDIETGVR